MNFFGGDKNNPTGKPETPPTAQSVRSRFSRMLEHMNQAYVHLDQVAHLSNTLIHDVEKGLRYIDRMRMDVTEALGQAEPAAAQMEDDIKDTIAEEFIPPKHRKKE